VRAIAFDLDNTLWAVEPVLLRAEARVYAWLEQHCPRITANLTLEDMRRAREALARRLRGDDRRARLRGISRGPLRGRAVRGRAPGT
jgi:phosphoglycolate phosphatase-like HAD superfamily hydrolase